MCGTICDIDYADVTGKGYNIKLMLHYNLCVLLLFDIDYLIM